MPYSFIIFLSLSIVLSGCAHSEEINPEKQVGVYSAYTADLENLVNSEMSATADMSFDPAAEQPFSLLVLFFDYTDAAEVEGYEVFLVKDEDRLDVGPMTYLDLNEKSIPMFLYNSQEDLTYYTDVEITLGEKLIFKGTFSPKL